ncbi:hypothetical protein BDV09DRAFT_164643 [Aspergillus tetrazonus]
MYPGSHVMAGATDLSRVLLHRYGIFTPFSIAVVFDNTLVTAALPVWLLLPFCPCRVAILVSIWTLAVGRGCHPGAFLYFAYVPSSCVFLASDDRV